MNVQGEKEPMRLSWFEKVQQTPEMKLQRLVGPFPEIFSLECLIKKIKMKVVGSMS
jgi:hypothetical protein